MAWFADLAGKAEDLLNNLDEQTGAALRSTVRSKSNRASDTSPSPPLSHMTLNNPPWNSNSKRSHSPKLTKRSAPIAGIKFNNVSVKSSHVSDRSRALVKEIVVPKESKQRTSKSPARKSIYNLNNCPATLVNDLKDVEPVEPFGLRKRRYNSLPTNLDSSEDSTLKIQNLEVENVMLKNEIHVINAEVTELLDRLKVTEDGNDVVCDEELLTLNMKLKNSEFSNRKCETDKSSLVSQLDILKKKVNDLTSIELAKHREQNKGLQFEIDMLKGRNKDLEELIREANERDVEHESTKAKLENELKHAQTTISELESNLDKTQAECRRLETEWDAYKLRVKSMLLNKDKEIKALQEGLNLTEDTKILIEQIEMLKDEREELSEAVSRVRGECLQLRRRVEEAEARSAAAERVVGALRDALREERDARSRAEAQGAARRKELKELENDTNITITSLRGMLRDKENEIARLRETSVRSADTSALNVADYDAQYGIDNDKIHCLTQTLVQKQGKIDALLADNNMLKIQMEKIESKYRSELSSLKAQAQRQSVVNVDDGRRARSDSALGAISRRLGVVFKRHPVFRVFMMFYMLGLHFWVITVLLTTSPEGYTNFNKKSIPNELTV